MTLDDALLRKLRGRRDEIAQDLADGSARDWPDYQRKVGIIEGMAFAERELLDLISKLNGDE